MTAWKLRLVFAVPVGDKQDTSITQDFYTDSERSLNRLLDPEVQKQYQFIVEGWSIIQMQPYNAILSEIVQRREGNDQWYVN